MRKTVAVGAAKMISFAGRFSGGKSSSLPGAVALKLCPDLIERLSHSFKKGVIVTCGTNGKTTTNNLLCSALEASGYRVVCNKLGANMKNGVATALAQASDLWGRIDADYACLEVDEASTLRVFEFLKPDVMIITNLFRDQLDRYGEIDITADLLSRAIQMAPDVKLVLNADDPLCAQFGVKERREAYYYGVSEQVLPQTDDTKEGRFCPICGAEQTFLFYHYSQLGNYYCPSCGFKRPNAHVEASQVKLSSPIRFNINRQPMRLNYKGFYNIYNTLSVYTALTALGESTENFQSLLANYQPQIGRMEEMHLGKPVILNLAKNPAGFNQAITTVKSDRRKKDIIIAINDNANDGRDISWLWDVDFERIRDERLHSLTTTGMRLYDIALRFKYSDVKVNCITPNMRSAIEHCLASNAEVLYILVNYSAMYETENIMLDLKQQLEA